MDEDKSEGNHQSNGKMFGRTLTWEEQLTVVRTMFPFVSTKEALKEKHFVRGYAYSCRIYAMEKREEWTSMKHILALALTEYQRSYEEAGTPEAIANLLWALCLGYVSSVEGEKVGAEKEEYNRECYETGRLLVGILRENKAYEELAEYYKTLLHVIGMDGNGAGVDLSKAV